MIGRYSNKLYKEKPTYSAEDPNILKTNYKECLQDIILKNLPNNFDYKQIKDKQNIYVHLYFDSSNLLPKEIYMSAMNFDIFSVFSQNDIKHIEDDIKKRIKATKNIGWINEKEINRQLNDYKVVHHLLGFNLKDLFLLKEKTD